MDISSDISVDGLTLQLQDCTYCNVLGVLFTKELYCTPKSQYTTVKHGQKLFEHTYTSDLYGPGALTPIGIFQQDLLWRSSNTHSHSCSQEASKHTRSIRHRAIGALAHHNGTSAHSPSLACHLPAPTIECLHRPPYRLTCFSHCFPDTTAPDRSPDPTV
jgi:hypothetical protein